MGDEREAPAITPVLARLGRSFPIEAITFTTKPDDHLDRPPQPLELDPATILKLSALPGFEIKVTTL